MDVLTAVSRKIQKGERLSEEDGVALLRQGDVLALGRLARDVKMSKSGRRVFFNVNCHINLTNVCVSRCAFCAFSCDNNDARAYCMTADEVIAKVRSAAGLGITEVHMVSGLHPDLPLDYYVDVIASIRRAFPEIHIKAFTPVEIKYFSEISGLDIAAVLSRLCAAGLGSLPGGGAEVLSDRVRRQLCPAKASAAEWLDIMRTAHECGLRSNATLLFGHIETARETVAHLLRLRDLQDQTGGFQTFIPLPFHPGNTQMSSGCKPTACEMLKMVSVARLVLDNIDHIKSYWVMMGLPVAQLSLHFGADDLDGTVTDEKITHAAGADTAVGVTSGDLVALIRQSGWVPVQRDTLYNVLSTYE